MHKIIRTVFLLLLLSVGQAESKYPADTLLTSDSLNLVQKAGVLPIAAWQRLSYNLPGLGCQFYPSCSNYGAHAVHEHGLVFGSIVTADRIIRCNPFAWHYHLKTGGSMHSDGRLVDNVIPAAPDSTFNPTKSPLLAAGMSAILPGSGRAYAGRPWDGLMGFITVTLTANAAYVTGRYGSNLEKGIFIPIAAIFYAGEIYGAWRSAKYYYPQHKIRQQHLYQNDRQ